jgi:hypothetical protein
MSGNLEEFTVYQKALDLFHFVVDDVTRYPGDRRLRKTREPTIGQC